MKVNPTLKTVFNDIAKASVDYENTKDDNRKYYRRLLHIFNTHLTESEKIFIIAFLLHNLHFKNLVFDDDNFLKVNNIKLRTYVFIFTLTLLAMIFAAIIFNTNESLNGFIVNIFGLFKFLSIL